MEPGGQFDLQQLIAAAAQVQSQLASAQQQLAETEVQGSAGGGMVKVTVNGDGELTDVTIAKEAIDPGDPAETAATIADLILAACRDAYRALDDAREDAMSPLAGSFGGAAGPGGIPGLPGFPGFPGMPGQSPVQGAVLPGDDYDEDYDDEDDDPDHPAGPGAGQPGQPGQS